MFFFFWLLLRLGFAHSPWRHCVWIEWKSIASDKYNVKNAKKNPTTCVPNSLKEFFPLRWDKNMTELFISLQLHFYFKWKQIIFPTKRQKNSKQEYNWIVQLLVRSGYSYNIFPCSLTTFFIDYRISSICLLINEKEIWFEVNSWNQSEYFPS